MSPLDFLQNYPTLNELASKLTYPALVAGIAGLLILRVLFLVIHRLYINPLAAIPGPKLAASTRLYEWYFQGWNHLKFPHQIKKLHKQYGPIVRISPFEVSINDSEFNIDLFFNSDTKLDKDPWYYYFGFKDAVFVLSDDRKHQERQKIMASHFRGSFWQSNFPMIQREVEFLMGKFERAATDHGEVNVSRSCRKTGNEIMRHLLLGEDYDGVNASSEDFGVGAEAVFQPLFRAASWSRHFHWMFTINELMPDWVLARVLPMAKHKREIEHMVRVLVHEHDSNNKPIEDSSLFYKIIDRDTSYRDRDSVAAVEEFMELLWGGREVLGHATSNIIFHLLNNPAQMKRLHKALKHTNLDIANASYAELQTIPYLWAVCKEGLRIQLGGNFRIPRVPREPVQYEEYVLPAGTSISVCPKFFHDDPAIYPDPESFRPERWLDASPEELAYMEKFWNPFGVGARTCGGRPMAYEVVFRTVANLFARYQLDWSNCDAESCMAERVMEAFPPTQSTGMRVAVHRWDDDGQNSN